jgi:hypothetical protein
VGAIFHDRAQGKLTLHGFYKIQMVDLPFVLYDILIEKSFPRESGENNMIFCAEDDNAVRDLMMYALNSAGFETKGFVKGSFKFLLTSMQFA